MSITPSIIFYENIVDLIVSEVYHEFRSKEKEVAKES